MKKMFFLGILIAIYSCEVYDLRLNFRNETKETIHIAFTVNDSLKYAEPISISEKQDLKYKLTYEILSGESSDFRRRGRNAWGKYVERAGYLNIFIINDTIFKVNNWQVINEKRLFKEMKISLNDLEKQNWIVTIQ